MGKFFLLPSHVCIIHQLGQMLLSLLCGILFNFHQAWDLKLWNGLFSPNFYSPLLWRILIILGIDLLVLPKHLRFVLWWRIWFIGPTTNNFYSVIWKIAYPNKIKVFFWKLSHGGLTLLAVQCIIPYFSLFLSSCVMSSVFWMLNVLAINSHFTPCSYGCF